ncbi:MAG: response regulator [Elusimicrobiales bacterium]|nr:response regulator [Elusimicrobiales bacterium]
MNLKLNSKTSAVAAGLVFLVMAGLAGLLYQNLSQWRDSETQIRHTRDSIRSSEELYSALLTAESAVRSYVINGSPEAMKPFSKAVSDLERQLHFLRVTEKTHTVQGSRLEKLEDLLKRRRDVMSTVVLTRRTKGFEAARALAGTGAGTRLTAEISALVNEMQEAERRDLYAWELQAKAVSLQRNRLLTIVFLFTFFILLGALGAVMQGAHKRRLAEEDLADAHARLRSVVDSATQVSIISTDLKGTITLFSAGAQKLLGYTERELAGVATPAVIHLASEIEARGEELTRQLGRPVKGFDIFVETARQGGYEVREWTYVAKDGRKFPVELVVTGVKDHNGTLVGFLGLATDISARKASQLQMRKLSAAIKASPTSIVITDRNGLIEYANPKFMELTGYTEKELLGQNPRVISSGSTPPAVYKNLWDTLLAGAEWQGEFLNRKKNGELFWEYASISPIKDSKGNITNFVAVKLDVTDRKLAQKETEKARDAAVELARMKSEFLANMSHEIRTPMNAIIGMTGLLLDTPLTAQQREYLKTVNGAGEGLLDIINDILDFSKIESGKLLIEKLDFNLRETVEGTADLLASRAQAKEIELAYYIPEGVPPGLRGDQGRLRQVLLNLMGNAVKFTEKGEVVLRVSAEKSGEGRATLKFSVTDTGIGVPAEAQKNLFASFSQADASTTRKYGGTGLGLSISKRLVELMGGAIGFESEHGKGSTFWFTLPFDVQAGEPAQEPVIADVAGARALIVDDNAANREIISRYLETWGMRYSAAPSGGAALELLKKEAGGPDPFRIMVLDMQMPGMDGLMLAAELKKDRSLAGLRAVMMTSLGHELGQQELDAAGISACLGKPVRPLALLKKISFALAGAAAPRPEPVPHVEPEAKPLNRHFRVLVAEDNTVNQKVAVKQLEKLGYASDVAANGLEVLEAMKRQPYDLVLMDCQMPEMDGFQATAEIRKIEADQRRTPIVAMTANALQGDRERCFAAGMDGYIPKPVRMDALAAALAQWDSPLDAFVIKELRDLAGPENPGFLADLARTYLGDLDGRLQAMKAAVKAGDAEALRQAAHSLKGSSGNIGAKRLQKLCMALEMLGKSGAVGGAEETLLAAEKETAAVRGALEALGGGAEPR